MLQGRQPRLSIKTCHRGEDVKTPGIILLSPHRLPPEFCISNALEFGTTNNGLLKTSVVKVSLVWSAQPIRRLRQRLVTCSCLCDLLRLNEKQPMKLQSPDFFSPFLQWQPLRQISNVYSMEDTCEIYNYLLVVPRSLGAAAKIYKQKIQDFYR